MKKGKQQSYWEQIICSQPELLTKRAYIAYMEVKTIPDFQPCRWDFAKAHKKLLEESQLR